MSSINYTASGQRLEWPSVSPIRLSSNPAVLALQMRLTLDALQEKSATFGINDDFTTES